MEDGRDDHLTAEWLRAHGTPEDVIARVLMLQLERELAWHAARDEALGCLEQQRQLVEARRVAERLHQENGKLRVELRDLRDALRGAA